MAALDPINGVSLEQYAKLCALMVDTNPEETEKHAEIALKNGISNENWEAAKKGWTERLSNPADAMELQKVFMPVYRDTLVEVWGNKPPCPLEKYAQVKAEMALKKDPATGMPNYMATLQEHGYSITQWGAVESFWTARIGDPNDPRIGKYFNEEDAMKFRELYQKEADKIQGIER